MRFTLAQIAQLVDLPEHLLLCRGDLPRLAIKLNEAMMNLIPAGSDTGWMDGWARLAFEVSRTSPYITTPYGFSRIAGLDICRFPVRIENQWAEYLEAGIGLRTICNSYCGMSAAYQRDNVVTAFDLPVTNQQIRVYYTDIRDVGKRILFSGAIDQNGNHIYSQDLNNPVNGFYLVFTAPFTTTDFIVTSFAAVAKDVTFGDVVVKSVDATTGVETFLARYLPNETSPQYRRYFLAGVPLNCCPQPSNTANTSTITVLAKYDFIPVQNPSDFLLISSVPALKAECQSIRLRGNENLPDKALAESFHRDAIKYLNQQLTNYLGDATPAFNVAPFGTARLSRQKIGSLL